MNWNDILCRTLTVAMFTPFHSHINDKYWETMEGGIFSEVELIFTQIESAIKMTMTIESDWP